jgi:hypothetical protein
VTGAGATPSGLLGSVSSSVSQDADSDDESRSIGLEGPEPVDSPADDDASDLITARRWRSTSNMASATAAALLGGSPASNHLHAPHTSHVAASSSQPASAPSSPQPSRRMSQHVVGLDNAAGWTLASSGRHSWSTALDAAVASLPVVSLPSSFSRQTSLSASAVPFLQSASAKDGADEVASAMVSALSVRPSASRLSHDSLAGDPSRAWSPALFSAMPLVELCGAWGNAAVLPEQLDSLLTFLERFAPQSMHPFRHGGNEALVDTVTRLLRCPGVVADFATLPVHCLAVVLKRFLRQLPDCLLVSALFNDWVVLSDAWAAQREPASTAREAAALLRRLPGAHREVSLRLLRLIRQVVVRRETTRVMSEWDASMFFAGCMLWPPGAEGTQSVSNVPPKAVPVVVEMLVSCVEDIRLDV